MKIIEYDVVSGDSFSDFAEFINIKISEGWQPIGGFSACFEFTGRGGDSDGVEWFYQAMVKYAE